MRNVERIIFMRFARWTKNHSIELKRRYYRFRNNRFYVATLTYTYFPQSVNDVTSLRLHYNT